MTAKSIQTALYLDRNKGARLICPNYTPADWFECDVFMVTKANLAVEYEIKISLADFRADATKVRDFYERRTDPAANHAERWRPTPRNKHDMLAARDPRGPSRFYYVFPAELNMSPEQMPEWAGMLTVRPIGHHRWGIVTERKPAPQLHRRKVDEKITAHCQGVFYWRYWNLRMALKPKSLTESQEGAESPQITGGSPPDF